MLITPINHLSTAENLQEFINDGVDEFYMGYMPKEWYQTYGWEISTNRRFFPVIPHIIEPARAKNLISFIHEKKKKIFLALNEHYYTEKQYSLLFKIIDLFEDLGIDGYIISDLALILAMRHRGITSDIHLSTCAGCYNLSAISFYRQFGISRFTLPRKLSINEIVYFLDNTPDEVRFEVFLMGEWCKFGDAFCFSSHGFNREHFCSTPFKRYLIDKNGSLAGKPNILSSNPTPWCGLCLIPELKKYHKRITFKLPIRSTGCPGLESKTLIKKVTKLLKQKTINPKQCKEVIGDACQRALACAYQLNPKKKR